MLPTHVWVQGDTMGGRDHVPERVASAPACLLPHHGSRLRLGAATVPELELLLFLTWGCYRP
eukprot:81988-Chlamydomonas_euryale.AAC.8